MKTLLGKIVDVEADVTDPAAWERLVGLASGLGGLDVLVSNAGVMASGPEAHVASARPSLVRRSLAVNFEGAWEGIRQCLPLLELRGGSVVAVASRAAEAGAPLAAAYAASKGGAGEPYPLARPSWRDPRASRSMQRRLARFRTHAHVATDFRPDGGPRRRSLVLCAHSARTARRGEGDRFGRGPSSRPDEASYITGTTLTIDGGQSCR